MRFYIFSGQWGQFDNPRLLDWMDSEGMASDQWKGIDWKTFEWRGKSQKWADELEECLAKFFMRHTKSELYNEALKRGIMLYPVATPSVHNHLTRVEPHADLHLKPLSVPKFIAVLADHVLHSEINASTKFFNREKIHDLRKYGLPFVD